MTYQISVASNVSSKNAPNNTISEFNLPETIFGTLEQLFPQQQTILMLPNTTEDVQLFALGFTGIKVLVVKSTRPINVTLTTAVDSFTIPSTTYLLWVIDTLEDIQAAVETITLTTPILPLAAPVPPPVAYPNTIVEIFVVATTV